jgi:hypothetical protein
MRNLISLLVLFLLQLQDAQTHPVHVTVLNIEFNQANGKIDLTFRVYKDDMELALFHNYQLQTTLDSTKAGWKSVSYLNRYINDKVKLKINNKQIDSLVFERTLWDGTNLWIYYSLKIPGNLQSIWLKNGMMMDLYFDQSNMIICGSTGKEKAYMLVYDRNEMSFDY